MIGFQMGYIIKLDCYYPYNTKMLAIKGIERRRRQYVVQPSYKIESKGNAKRSEHCNFSKRSLLCNTAIENGDPTLLSSTEQQSNVCY